MSYAGPLAASLPPVYLSSFSRASVGRFFQVTPVSAAWTGANRIIYVPFSLSHSVTVYKYFWLNGATVGTNNLQVGVYKTDFTQINEGTSTLSAGTVNLCQYDNITDYALGPGRYYMALWCSGTTATVFGSISAAFAAQGLYYETNASGLPATGTPANPATVTPTLPVFGLVLRSSP